MAHLHSQWQYQAKAEPLFPVPAVEVSFGWFVQGSDLFIRARRIVTQPTDVPVIQIREVSASTGIVLGGRKVISQSLAFVDFSVPTPAVVSIDWLYEQQRPRYVRRNPAGDIAGGFTPIIPDFGWHVAQPDIVRRKRIVLEGGVFAGFVPVTPSFDWLVAQPDIARRKRIVLEGGETFVDTPIIPSFGWNIPQPDIVRLRRIVLEGGVFVGFVPIIPPFDWRITQPDIVRRKFIMREGGASTGFVPIVPSFGWFEQQADVIRRKFVMREGGETFVDEPRVPFDWRIPQPDVVRRMYRPEGSTVGGFSPIVSFSWNMPQPDVVRSEVSRIEGRSFFVADTRTPFDWEVQEADVTRRKTFINQGGTSFVDEPRVAAFDWGVQEADVVRRPVRRIEGGSSFVDEPIVAFSWDALRSDIVRRPVRRIEGGETFVDTPIVSFSWDNRRDDPIRRKPMPQAGGATFVQDDQRVIIDWLVPRSDLIRREQPTQEGGSVFIEAPRVVFDAMAVPQAQIIRQKPVVIDVGETLAPFVPPRVIFEWFQQQPEPVRETEQRGAEYFTTGFDTRTNFEWNTQHPNPVRRTPLRLISAVTEVFRPETPSAAAWKPIYPDTLRPAPWRQYWNIAEFRTETGPEQTSLDKWWVQHFNPTLRHFRPPSNVVMPITFFTPGVSVVFVLNPCLEAWQFFTNSLLPFASGFEGIFEVVAPSGYSKPVDQAPTPSGWVRGDSKTPWNLAR